MGSQGLQCRGGSAGRWEVDGFSPELRVHADLASVRWLVLPALLESGEKFYAAMRGKTKQPAGHHGQRATGGVRQKRLKLKARDPW